MERFPIRIVSIGPVDNGVPSTVVARRGKESLCMLEDKRRARPWLMTLSWEPESRSTRTVVEALAVRRVAGRIMRFSESAPGSRDESRVLGSAGEEESDVNVAGMPGGRVLGLEKGAWA